MTNENIECEHCTGSHCGAICEQAEHNHQHEPISARQAEQEWIEASSHPSYWRNAR